MRNQLTVEALRVKSNEISNAIRQCKQQIARLMADNATIHAALKVMGSDSNGGQDRAAWDRKPPTVDSNDGALLKSKRLPGQNLTCDLQVMSV
jgi:hypothetical protein